MSDNAALPVTPSPSQFRRPSRHSNMWPLAMVLIVLMLVVGGPLAYLAVAWGQAARNAANTPRAVMADMSHAAAEAMRPKLTMTEIVVNTLADVQKESKLVVFTADVNVDVTREEGSTSWGMYWGTNVARISVRDAKAHYVIDLDKLQTSDFIYSESARVLTVSVPRPHIDTQMVAIDPANIQTLDLRSGWMRWNKYETRDNAIRELKPRVIIQAGAPFVRELASSAGVDAMNRLLQPLADTLAKDGVMVRVQYRAEER